MDLFFLNQIKVKTMGAIAFIASLALMTGSCEQSNTQYINMSETIIPSGLKTDTATFATGCFWCTEAIFQELKGVLKATSGYSGGHVANPSYEDVCTGTTGHAECLQIVYDPTVISF